MISAAGGTGKRGQAALARVGGKPKIDAKLRRPCCDDVKDHVEQFYYCMYDRTVLDEFLESQSNPKHDLFGLALIYFALYNCQKQIFIFDEKDLRFCLALYCTLRYT